MNQESIFEKTTCLSEQKLRDYLQGTLNEAETHAVEVHLADCEFCTEALEGLSNVTHQRQIPVIVQQIRRQFRRELQAHQSKHKKVKLYLWLSVVVLCIIIILLFAYFAINYTMKKERQQQPATQQTEMPVHE